MMKAEGKGLRICGACRLTGGNLYAFWLEVEHKDCFSD